MGRILGIDYGKKRMGLALSDQTKILASTWTVVEGIDLLGQVLSLISSRDIEAIVIGLPLLLSGQESDRSKEVRTFAHLLEGKSNLKVFFQDERLTSKEVEKVLALQGIKRKKRGKYVDALSATLILQTYLNRLDIHAKRKALMR